MRVHSTVLLCIVGGAALSASAQPVFIAFVDETMYRFNLNDPLESFQLTDKMMSLTRAPDGRFVGHSAERNSGSNLWDSYELVGALGNNPSLSMLSDQVPGPRPTLSFAGGNAYSTREDANDLTELITVDPFTLVDSGLVGNTGLGRSTNGSGYDPVNDVLYVINGTSDSLYTVDRGTGAATLVGSLGLDYFNGGAEFFDGTLYAFIQDTSRQEFVLGTIDASTGQFSFLRSITAYDPNVTHYASLAVVPAPATLSLLGLGILARRRRR